MDKEEAIELRIPGLDVPAIVSAQDLAVVSHFSWSAMKNPKRRVIYVKTHAADRKTLYLHRLIANEMGL